KRTTWVDQATRRHGRSNAAIERPVRLARSTNFVDIKKLVLEVRISFNQWVEQFGSRFSGPRSLLSRNSPVTLTRLCHSITPLFTLKYFYIRGTLTLTS